MARCRSRNPRWPTCAVALLLLFAACGDDVPGGEPPPPPPPAAPIIATVETEAPARIRAGDPIVVSCRPRTADGEEVTAAGARIEIDYAPAGAVELTESGALIATRTGDLQATCRAGTPSVFDATPALIAVEPGPVTQLVTHLDRTLLSAGEVVTARCGRLRCLGQPVASRATEPARRARARSQSDRRPDRDPDRRRPPTSCSASRVVPSALASRSRSSRDRRRA